MRILWLLLCGLTISACEHREQAPLVASEVSIAAPMAGAMMSAGYLSLTNNSDADIRVTAFTSPQFGAIEMHESVIENGISSMRPLHELLIKAGETLTFEPGGKHLMLMQPAKPLGNITLNILDGETILLSINTTPTGN